MKTMLAAVLHDFNDLGLEQVPVPEPKRPGEVVVRIKACGVCATDYKAIKGSSSRSSRGTSRAVWWRPWDRR